MWSKVFWFGAVSIVFIGCASSKEKDYTLVCDKKADWNKKEVSKKAIHVPLNFRITFTGKTSKQKETDGTFTSYDNLILLIGDKRMSGGAVHGSTYDSSSIFDESFALTGRSNTTWAWSRDADAWTLLFENENYVCRRK